MGYDVSLEADAINFGTVCLGSSRTKRLQLSNAGEMASRFRWEPKTFGPHIRWAVVFDTCVRSRPALDLGCGVGQA